MDHKKVLEQLVKIAQNQQAIITKLAAHTDTGKAGNPAPANPNIGYLKGAAQVSASNSGFNATNVEVEYYGAASHDNIVEKGNYVVKVSGAPQNNQIRQKFLTTFKTQIQTQKPELSDNVSIMLV
jgi:hypothetical protein